MIAWLTRRFSRDPGQLGLFELATVATDATPVREPLPAPPRMPEAALGQVAVPPLHRMQEALGPQLVPPPHRTQEALGPVAVAPLHRTQEAPGPVVLAPLHRTQEAPGPVVEPLPHRMPEARLARVSPAIREASGDACQTRVDPDALLHALRENGLRGVDRVVLTRNRRTMVSLAGGVLRVHEGFAAAPPDVHSAIATFATSRNRAKRSAARDIIVAYPVPVAPPARRPAAQHPDDVPMAARLTLLHAQLNLEHFGGRLDPLEILVSRRLARRLGHYTLRAHAGGRGEIVISRRHVRRDGWPEAIHTLLHEMVHQWQDETGRPVDHGRGFRAKCRAVGIEPAATRMLPR